MKYEWTEKGQTTWPSMNEKQKRKEKNLTQINEPNTKTVNH